MSTVTHLFSCNKWHLCRAQLKYITADSEKRKMPLFFFAPPLFEMKKIMKMVRYGFSNGNGLFFFSLTFKQGINILGILRFYWISTINIFLGRLFVRISSSYENFGAFFFWRIFNLVLITNGGFGKRFFRFYLC